MAQLTVTSAPPTEAKCPQTGPATSVVSDQGPHPPPHVEDGVGPAAGPVARWP